EVKVPVEEVKVPVEKEEREDDGINKEAIISNINSEESFITYHVHTVTSADTVEAICSKYNISLNDLKKLNNVDELTINSKLIIASEEDAD
ncbi:MAG: LysM domain-containing protein, partial [Bacilli bacterium]|nr:LysM domain-containing protein [Bacilli bacterium]